MEDHEGDTDETEGAEEDRVSALIRTTPKKSGADVYGWTYEHLQTLIGDKDAIKTLTGTLNHILGNRITSETAKDLNTVRVPPLLKRDKREHKAHHGGEHPQKICSFSHDQMRETP